MTQALALLSLVLLALAGAVELWWGSAARQQERRALHRLEETLAVTAPSPPAAQAQARPRAAPAWPQERLHPDALYLRAGLPTGWRTTAALALPGAAAALLGGWRLGSAWAAPLMLGAYAALLWLWLRRRIERQRQQLLRQLPDFLDGMVRLSSIGNSLPMAFQSIAAGTRPPLRAVLDRTLQSARAGLDLDRALQLAARPYRLQELELLHVVLGTGMRIGGRADQILQRMSDFMRDLAHARQELHAITSETRLSAWVLGLLPVLVTILMSLLNPAFFLPMFTQPLGHKLLLAALGLEVLGVFLLYRLARSL
ncbi:type II secretion system F family protein [Fulvimonas soli]|uniref:Tight adherence protein B n=1 Tax=Fulvimonas soli TaxID=155197 RepID=A0A316I0P4_9GAMM|nr:type II secretion system F family protein [Fulvimonas soli]PWK85852.1 tight adherence protein B [Fulvimonas soli]TNY27244.1 pilus assembly protein [Fulvimonas soli]